MRKLQRKIRSPYYTDQVYVSRLEVIINLTELYLRGNTNNQDDKIRDKLLDLIEDAQRQS